MDLKSRSGDLNTAGQTRSGSDKNNPDPDPQVWFAWGPEARVPGWPTNVPWSRVPEISSLFPGN